MAVTTKNWDSFVEYLIDWCNRESNSKNILFSCKEVPEFSCVKILYVNSDINKKTKMIFTKENYNKLASKFSYSEICSNITQTMKDKFRWNSKRRFYKQYEIGL